MTHADTSKPFVTLSAARQLVAASSRGCCYQIRRSCFRSDGRVLSRSNCREAIGSAAAFSTVLFRGVTLGVSQTFGDGTRSNPSRTRFKEGLDPAVQAWELHCASRTAFAVGRQRRSMIPKTIYQIKKMLRPAPINGPPVEG